MKIDVNKIPPEGAILKEDIDSSELDLDTDIIKVGNPIRATAEVARITNTVSVNLQVEGSMQAVCGRCLNEFGINFNKEIKGSYPLNKGQLFIDLNPDIREEMILDYPIAPVCQKNCQGLCLKCGENLNKGKCACLPN